MSGEPSTSTSTSTSTFTQSPNPKQRRAQHHLKPKDRLTTLPDLPLTQILSNLPFPEAAKTTLISKRFNSLWTSLSHLTFSESLQKPQNDAVPVPVPTNGAVTVPTNLIHVITRALKSHDGNSLTKLSVKLKYHHNYSPYIDTWTSIALEKKVKSLELIFNATLAYNLPIILSNNKHLVELRVKCCKLPRDGRVEWSSLRIMCLERVKLSEEVLERVLEGCGSLEVLEVREWSGVNKWKIGQGSSLRELRIWEERMPEYVIMAGDEVALEVEGCGLRVLEIGGRLFRTEVKVGDVGGLERVELGFKVAVNFKWKAAVYEVKVEEVVRGVLERFGFVREVIVGAWFVKVLSSREAYSLSSPISDRRILTLCVSVNAWDYLGVASMMYSSPCLETLVIRLSYCSDVCGPHHAHDLFNKRDDEHYWKLWTTISKCTLSHLKSIKVIGCEASHGAMKPLFQFVEFLIRHSKELEQVVIRTSRYVSRGALDQALNLLSVPMASPDVVVHFEPPHLWIDPHCVPQYNSIVIPHEVV